VLYSGDLLDENYAGSFNDAQILLDIYEPNFIDLVNDELTMRNTLLCYNNHLLYYYIIKQKIIQYPDCKFILVDAHQEMLNETLNSCSFLRHLIEEGVLNSTNLLLLGIRVFDEDAYIAKHNIIQYTTNDWIGGDVLTRIKRWIAGSPVYVSIDIDVLDNTYAPGCVDPEPNGMNPFYICDLVWFFAQEQLVGMDLAEVDLSKDDYYQTTYHSAKTILKTMYTVLCLAKNQH
jgi:arginase family enzyme